jgi:P27 family predicted phage terminase small subunit
MSGGRVAAPTALKLLKGVRPARINKKEPKPKSVSGALPTGWGAHMSDGAKRFWTKYAPILSNLGVLTEADLPALRVLAEVWSRWVKCSQALIKAQVDPAEELAYMRMADKLESQMLRYLHEFGMTASSRGRIVVGGQSDDEDEGFLD